MSTSAVTEILQGAGLTGSALSSAVSSVVGLFNTTKSQTKTALNAILQVSSDPKAVDDAITKLTEVSGLQSSIMALVPAMRAAESSPVQLGQLVATAQSELNN